MRGRGVSRDRCEWSRSGDSFFFFQAEDGIRDYKVTGVQTCALPILCRTVVGWECCAGAAFGLGGGVPGEGKAGADRSGGDVAAAAPVVDEGCSDIERSEERRVGKEGRSRWSPYH